MAFALATATNDARAVIEARLAAQWVSGDDYRTAIQYPAVLGLIDTDGAVIMSPPTDTAWLKLDVSIHAASSRCGELRRFKPLAELELMLVMRDA